MFGGCTNFDPQLSDEKKPMIADSAVLTLGEGVLTQIHSHAHMPSCMHAHTGTNFRG